MAASDYKTGSDYEKELDKLAEEYLLGNAVPPENTPELIEAFGKEFELISDSDPLPPIAIKEKCRPCADPVFTAIMQDPELLQPFLECVTGKKVKLDKSTIHAQFQFANASVEELNAVRVDTHALDEDGSNYAVDIQRTYEKHGLRVMNRTIYYSSKQFSSQKVIDMKYEDLKSSYVVFIMSEHIDDRLSGVVHYFMSREFDDGTVEHLKGITDIYEIYAPVSKISGNKFNPTLQIFAEFFSIKDERDAVNFSNKYSGNPLGRRLIRNYAVVSRDDRIIDRINREEFYMFKRGNNLLAQSRAEGILEGISKGKAEGILEGISKGRAEGITERDNEILENMRRIGFSDEIIRQVLGGNRPEIRP